VAGYRHADQTHAGEMEQRECQAVERLDQHQRHDLNGRAENDQRTTPAKAASIAARAGASRSSSISQPDDAQS
jgi:hypothetical protein